MSTEKTVAGKTIYEVGPSNTRDTTNDDADRFDQSKKEWAAELDSQASAYLQEHFGVAESDIYDYEGLTSGEYDVTDVERALQIWDYTGIDKLVDLGSRIIGVAYRFRPNSEQYDVDFSYCVDNGTDEYTAEYDKHTEAHEKGGIYPTFYAFGITDASETTIEEFHLIEMDPFLDCVRTGALNPDGPHARDGGVEALYYSVDELDATGCIARSWGGDE